MSRRFGQYCGLARALEMVGERWALLVLRDLILGPKRFMELRAGLPRIPTSILAARLNELEEAGVVRRRILPELDASVVYELTEYGAELEPILLLLGLWGARSLGEPAADDVFTRDSAMLSLYTTFHPDRAAGVTASFELRLAPDMVLQAVVNDGELKVFDPPYGESDLIVSIFGSIKPLFSGEVSTTAAISSGLVTLEGDPAMFETFAGMFHIPSAPAGAEVLAVH